MVKSNGPRCYECEGSGQTKSECHTFLKKQKNGFSITWSDSDDDGERETTNLVMAFTRKYVTENDSNDEEWSVEEPTIGVLYTKWEESCLIMENQKRAIYVL